MNMEQNSYKIEIDGKKYDITIIPVIESDRSISFKIKDLFITPAFAIKENAEKKWYQVSGDEEIDQSIIDEVGLFCRKQYL